MQIQTCFESVALEQRRRILVAIHSEPNRFQEIGAEERTRRCRSSSAPTRDTCHNFSFDSQTRASLALSDAGRQTIVVANRSGRMRNSGNEDALRGKAIASLKDFNVSAGEYLCEAAASAHCPRIRKSVSRRHNFTRLKLTTSQQFRLSPAPQPAIVSLRDTRTRRVRISSRAGLLSHIAPAGETDGIFLPAFCANTQGC